MRFAHALKWSFLSELAIKAIQPVVFIALARLLSPDDFGVMSAALMVISFSQIFWEAGMSKALIQRQTHVEDAANAAFWINLTLSFAIATLLYIIANPVAQTLFHDTRVADVLQVMTLQIVLGALSSVHTALLQKEMAFKKLFWVRFATVGLPGLASIPLAWHGMGHWALVIGTLIGQFVQVRLLWELSRWRPQWSFPIAVAKEMGQFGGWVGASGLMGWFYVWADSMLVGAYFGSHELGLYRTGNLFASMIFGMLLGPIIPVLYSHLSSLNKNLAKLRNASEITIKSLSLVTIPTCIILFTLSMDFSRLLFGIEWDGIELSIGIFLLVHGYAWIVGMNGEFYRAAGKPRYETIAMLVTMPIYFLTYLYFVDKGMHEFLFSRLAMMFLGLVFQLIIANRILNIDTRETLIFLCKVSLISVVCVYIVESCLIFSFQNIFAEAIIHTLAHSLTIGIALYFMERNGIIKEVIAFIYKEPIRGSTTKITYQNK